MTRPDIFEQCKNRWPSILPIFGVSPKFLTGHHTPCPICNGGRDRFRFDDKEGRGTWFCNTCGAGTGVSLIMAMTGMDFKQACRAIREKLSMTVEGPAKKAPNPERLAEKVRALWQTGKPIGLDGEDEATRYLVNRGLNPPYPMCLRFVPACPIVGHPTAKFLPAMIAPITHNGKLVNVHRTYLENGNKAVFALEGVVQSPRRVMAGTLPEGSVIRLSEAQNAIMGIAEGIETALAVTQRFGMVCWSALNATMLEKFVPPPGLKEFHIFGDNDRKFGGQAAAYRLAHRSATSKDAPANIAVHIPTKAGTDWADGISALRAVS